MIPVKKIFAVATLCAFCLISCGGSDGGPVLSVTGDVKDELSLDRKALTAMAALTVRDVPLISEKTSAKSPEKVISVSTFSGVLLRDILYRAGMKHVRKWEPGVFIRVIGTDGKAAVFSFGEIFYSGTGSNVFIALEKDGDATGCDSGPGELVVANDLRDGRNLKCVSRVEVGRVDVELHAYNDQKNNVMRPPKNSFDIIDQKTGAKRTFTPGDLSQMPSLSFRHAILIGECAGFKGIHSFSGVPLRLLLESAGYGKYPVDYSRYVLATCESGFCATFSFGEIFNSRLDDNILIATLKNGKPLGDEGFSMSVVREDGKGGRSVKRINKIVIY